MNDPYAGKWPSTWKFKNITFTKQFFIFCEKHGSLDSSKIVNGIANSIIFDVFLLSCCHLEPSGAPGAIWSYLEQTGAIWSHLDLSGAIRPVFYDAKCACHF